MGIYAEAAIWAIVNGRDPEDMDHGDWEAFYEEYDAEDERKAQRRPRSTKNHCPLCKRKLANPDGVRNHLRDYHKNEKGRAALAAIIERQS